ncbi:HET domain containing protein [Hyaloscypha variabilis]
MKLRFQKQFGKLRAQPQPRQQAARPEQELATQLSDAVTSCFKTPDNLLRPYQYQPLQAQDAIRMVELLPGTSGDPICVKIHHRTLSDMPNCSAVSYEWGSSVREHAIFCDGRTIKVTANLLLLLSKFRNSDSSRLLWIDAICINQDDLDERSRQVQLMGKIYSDATIVLMWIGDETIYTEEAISTIRLLAALLRTFKLKSGYNELDFEPYEYEQILDSFTTDWLRETSFVGAGDLFSRHYFTRLWIIQEVALSSEALIVCGRYQIHWKPFYQAAMCIHILGSKHGLDMSIFDHLLDINLLGQLTFHKFPPSMLLILRFFSYATASDPRDYIYGYLGIFKSRSINIQMQVDYASTVEDVFRKSTEILIFEEQSLDHFTDFNVEPQCRSKTSLPSWARDFGNLVDDFCPLRVPEIEGLLGSVQTGQQRVLLEGDYLTARGLIIDSIQDVSNNLCDANFPQILLQTFISRLSGFTEMTTANIDTAAREIRQCFDRTSRLSTQPSGEESLFALIASFHIALLTDFGLISSMTSDLSAEDSKRLLDREYLHPPQLSTAFKDDSRTFECIQNIIFVKWSISQHIVSEDMPACLQLLEIRLEEKSLGVNIFKSSKGFGGHGPGGQTDEGALPAVRVGDHIVLFPTVDRPMIIREREGEEAYTLIGTAHVRNLTEIPWYEGETPELTSIRLR